MGLRTSRTRILFWVVVLASGGTSPAWGQYSLNWFTVDGGGTTQASGGSFMLRGTIGQPDAGLMSGGAYTLRGGFWSGGQGVVGVGDDPEQPTATAPVSFRLHGAMPNPLLNRTTVRFDMPEPRRVRVTVYDPTGRHVRTLADGPFPAGRHQLIWDATDDQGRTAATGIYFVRFDAETMRARQKVVVIR